MNFTMQVNIINNSPDISSHSPRNSITYRSMLQVVNESLRMASVAPGILRRAIRDIHVDGNRFHRSENLRNIV